MQRRHSRGSQGSSRDKRQNRNYQVKKSGIKDELIDRQILAIHIAMVEKLLAHPELHQQVFETLEERLETGKLRYGGYMTWYSLMDNIDNEKLFRQGVLEDSPRMKKLRRSTPLVGILTEEERQQALMKAACGEANIEHLMY
ncbi:hypothetical protein [Paraneptunicella aestuarii]|uniref:hypothetical protein n=1 Tax=Paraneptunicella aestuarii TaxID=2831148 RepID=UPI001E4D31B3|nr:hypothetical protein [Paraneptunicella aestuarii]